MTFRFVILLLLTQINSYSQKMLLPIDVQNRSQIIELQLTEIGEFGLLRKDRPQVPGHFHAGIDIKRPNNNYENSPIFPVAEGIVISKRDDGPFAQLIIEHRIQNKTFWSVYEHTAGIKVDVNDIVDSDASIARFMNKNELNKYGWQFDHFHFEVLKKTPIKLKFDPDNPSRRFNSFSLICFNNTDLEKYYYSPIRFMEEYFNARK